MSKTIAGVYAMFRATHPDSQSTPEAKQMFLANWEKTVNKKNNDKDIWVLLELAGDVAIYEDHKRRVTGDHVRRALFYISSKSVGRAKKMHALSRKIVMKKIMDYGKNPGPSTNDTIPQKSSEFIVFTTSIAPSGRAKCKSCKLLIPQGDLRVSRKVPYLHTNTIFHYHLECGMNAASRARCTGQPQFSFDDDLTPSQQKTALSKSKEAVKLWSARCS